MLIYIILNDTVHSANSDDKYMLPKNEVIYGDR